MQRVSRFILGGGSGSGVGSQGSVDTFADLPPAADHAGEIYVVNTTTGVAFLTRKKRGQYKSDGTAWTYFSSFIAAQIDYNSADSDLTAVNVKAGLDEVAGRTSITTWDQLSEWATANATNVAYAYNSDDQITTVTRTVPTGTIVTTFGYTDGRVTTKTLSGDFPSHAAAGINLVQTLTYNADGEIIGKG